MLENARKAVIKVNKSMSLAEAVIDIKGGEDTVEILEPVTSEL